MQKLLIFYDSHTEKIIFSRIYQNYMYVYKICFNLIVIHCHYCHYPKVEFVKYFIRARFHVCQYLFIIPQEHHMIVVPVIVFTSMLMLFSTLNSQHTQTNFPKQNFQLTNIHTISRSSWLNCALIIDD